MNRVSLASAAALVALAAPARCADPDPGGPRPVPAGGEDRLLRPGEARRGEADPRPAGRPADPRPPAVLRPDRPAADARGGRGLRQGPVAEGLREARGPLARRPALR